MNRAKMSYVQFPNQVYCQLSQESQEIVYGQFYPIGHFVLALIVIEKENSLFDFSAVWRHRFLRHIGAHLSI
jgi:hypothetical protein